MRPSAIRAREAGSDDLRRKRQQLLSFLLRHGRIYDGGGHWTLAHRRWLARQAFEHTAHQIVFQEGIDAIEDAAQRLHRLDGQLAAIVPSWSMAPLVEAYQAMRGASFLGPAHGEGGLRWRCSRSRTSRPISARPTA